jgi:NADH dehydrogenase
MKITEKKRVLIVGGGFAGVKAAMELCASPHFAVTLLSDRPDFYYFPTLYHTATGGTIRQSRLSLESLLGDKPIHLAHGAAVHLDRHKKAMRTSNGKTYTYDILVLALGVVTNYFGIDGLREYSYSIKSPSEARRFKDHLHRQIADSRRPDLNYVIVGGGPTGIELAGALPSYLKSVMAAHGIRDRNVHIDLVESSPKLVPRMPSRMSKAVARHLRGLGVRLYLGQTVQGETTDALMVNGKPIQSHTVVWTAGVTNHPFFKENDLVLTDRGKVEVDDYLQAEPNIYVLGDNANTPYSGMAQTALHDAIFVSRNLARGADGALMQRYIPKEPVYVIPAGPGWAAVQWGKVQLYGWLGWILRSMADFRGFHDYEPWWRASVQWMTEFDEEEECPTCHRA